MKSRRRAKAGGSGGGSKAPGGSGTGAGRAGTDASKKRQTAKNDENIHPAGILTSGAVRMFSQCTKQKWYLVPKNSAPVLQVVSKLEEEAS